MYYPNLVSAMAVREIKGDTIASTLRITGKAFRNKISGKNEFKFQEAEKIQAEFFSDIPILELFAHADPGQQSGA